MNRIIIPRRDHEVYFIPAPETLKHRSIRSFIAAQMEKLHPGFSNETALDIKRLAFNKERWLMVTVMEAEAMTEYRILHKGAAFFTNTSIEVYKKGFIQGGVKKIEDELIGFDSEKNSPVSIPLEPNGPESPSKAVKNVPRKCGVFAGRMPAWRVISITACAALLSLFPLIFFPAAKEAITMDMPVVAAEPAPIPKYLPPAVEILAEFSADLVKTGAKLARWQYNEGPGTLLTIETRGVDVLSIRRLFNQYPYIVLEDILDVRYIDGEPYLSFSLNASGKGYLMPGTGTFFSQGFSLPIFSELTSELRQHGISIVSETLPSAENGNALYTLIYTAKDLALIHSMEVITAICDKYPVRVLGMDVSLVGEGSLFAVVCSLSQSDAPRYDASGLGEGEGKIPRESIPKAFGYREDPPPLPPPKAVVAKPQAPQTPQEPQAPPAEKQPEVTVIGTIRDDHGQMLFYREAGDKKVMIKDTP